MGAEARCDRPLPLPPPAGRSRSGLGGEDLLALVDQVAALLPSVPRLQLLDVVDGEWVRLRAAAEPLVAAFVVPAAVLRLRSGPDSVARGG